LIFNEVNQMKPAEAKVLEGLRKNTLAYLSDKEYAQVVEAVEKQGILGLTGAASRLVKGAVIKHASHNQASHGRRGGGGGGGGASSSDRLIPSRDLEEISGAMEKIEDAQVSLNDFDDEDSDNYIEDMSDGDLLILERTSDDLKEALSHLNNSYENRKLKDHLDEMEFALEGFNDVYDNLRNADAKALLDLADKIEDISAPLEEIYGDKLGR